MKVFKSLDRQQFNISILKFASALNFGNLLFFVKNAEAHEEYCSTSHGTASDGWIEHAIQWINRASAFFAGIAGQDYGNDQIHDAVYAAADSAYAHGHGRLGVTAISLNGGGDMPGSQTHENGTCYDCRYMGNNGNAHTISDSTYSRAGTYDFISELHEQIMVVQVVTADSTLATQLKNNLGISSVVTDTTHNDHVHIQVANPDG